MKIRQIFLSLIIALPFSVMAQQDPLYAQYMLNPLLINPAYAGLNSNFNVMAGYRIQWTGLEGQPQTLNVSSHTSLMDNKVGAGILVTNDRIGNISNLETSVLFSYKLNLQETTFSFGMQAGVQNFRTDYLALDVFDRSDDAFSGEERGTRMNIGAGAILKNEKYFIGVSVPRLLPSTFKNGGQSFELYNQHLYLTGSYVHYLNEHLRLKPSVLLRGVKGAPFSVDLAMNVNLNAIHTGGLFTRNFKSYGFLVQTLIKEQLRFGYVFELPTNKSVGTNFTSHEISVGILFSAFSSHERSLSNF
jgi:type IX secretion system PorP/SprF family membrane protein